MDGELTLAERIKHRIGQDFDGECHLTEEEANEVIRALTPAPGEVREKVARIIDPDAWSFADRHAGKPVLQPEVTFETRRSPAKADAILSSLQGEAQPVADDAVEVAAKAYAGATGYYVPFHRGLSSVSADQIRTGIRAALAAASHPSPEQAGEVERLRAEVSDLKAEQALDREFIESVAASKTYEGSPHLWKWAEAVMAAARARLSKGEGE